MRVGRTIGGAMCVLVLCSCASTTSRAPAFLSADDLDRFDALMARAGPTPDAATLQRDYLAPGSAALQAFDRETIGGAARLADAIAGQPARWRDALERCGAGTARAAFHHDRATMRAHWRGAEPDAIAIEAGTRWFWNAGTPGRPQDLGYWIGQRIWHGYVVRAPDRTQALRRLLTLDDPDAVLQGSGYGLAAAE